MTGETQKAFHGNGAGGPFVTKKRGLDVTLENMFYLSQTIAGLAIVGSLLFVAMEVRSSNQVNRHRMIEELNADYGPCALG